MKDLIQTCKSDISFILELEEVANRTSTTSNDIRAFLMIRVVNLGVIWAGVPAEALLDRQRDSHRLMTIRLGNEYWKDVIQSRTPLLTNSLFPEAFFY